MYKFYLAFIVIFYFSACEEQTPIEKFRQGYVTTLCNTMINCCKAYDEIGIYQSFTYQGCLEQYGPAIKEVFNEKNFEIDESQLNYVLKEFKKFHEGDCLRPNDPRAEDALGDIFSLAFKPKLEEGEQCNNDAACIDGYCDKMEPHICVKYSNEGEDCDYPNKLCQPGMHCVYGENSSQCVLFLAGDDCVEGECGPPGYLICDPNTNKCIEARENLEACNYDGDCISRNCEDDICQDESYLDAHCLN